MAEINLRVKIICGPRTDLEVYTISQSVNNKTLTTKSGVKFTDQEMEAVIDKAIIKFIEGVEVKNGRDN